MIFWKDKNYLLILCHWAVWRLCVYEPCLFLLKYPGSMLIFLFNDLFYSVILTLFHALYSLWHVLDSSSFVMLIENSIYSCHHYQWWFKTIIFFSIKITLLSFYVWMQWALVTVAKEMIFYLICDLWYSLYFNALYLISHILHSSALAVVTQMRCHHWQWEFALKLCC